MEFENLTKLVSKQNIVSFFAAFIGPIIFVSTFAVYFLTLNGVWATDHTSAFVEFDYSIWANHSFALGKVGSFTPASVDVFQYNGNYFMANAPGAAFISLPFAVIAFIVYGHFTVFGDVLILTEIPVALANSLASYFVFRISNLYFKKEISTFLAFCYAFSTISWPFATFLYQSDLSALFDLIAVYFAIKIGRAGERRKGETIVRTGNASSKPSDKMSLALFCGLAVAAAVIVDYVNAVLIPIIGAYVFFSVRKQTASKVDRIKFLVAFLAESVGLTFFLLGIYNYASFGKVFASSEQMYLNGANVFESFTFPVYKGIVLNLFTPMRGLFFFSPILVLGVFGIWKMRRRTETLREALLFLVVFLGIIVPYSAWYSVTGGVSFGPRFLIASIPFLLIPGGFVISEVRDKKYSFGVVYLLYAAGVLQNGVASMIGVLTPPSSSWLSSPFLSNIMPDLMSGQLDSWWKYDFGFGWIIVAALIVSFALVFPMACDYTLRKSQKALKGVSKNL
ncbi:MAG: hypothetical protein ACREBS_10090 [Nitrososphaerales archaeon]